MELVNAESLSRQKRREFHEQKQESNRNDVSFSEVESDSAILVKSPNSIHQCSFQISIRVSRMWKSILRQSMWEMMEASGRFRPIPVQGMIPDFEASEIAVHRLTTLEEFEKAKVVKVDLIDTQFYLRRLMLQLQRTLLVTRREFEDSFFAVLCSTDVPLHYTLDDASRREGFTAFARPVPLVEAFKTDLAVVRSLAVDPRTGSRVSVGEGSSGMGSDLEYGILTELGAIDEGTTLITLVDPEQVIEFGVQEMEVFDIPVDIIITPYETYRVQDRLPRPKGVIWDLLEDPHFQDVPCLRNLKSRYKEFTN